MLYIVATPIGNMEDISLRAIRILGEVEVLACEDTRRTRKLYEKLKIPSPGTIISYHEHNEERTGLRILDMLKSGRDVALCSDAGYPGISDPGYKIISAAMEAELNVCVVPGAGAVATAIVSSGLPTASYTFKGYPPRRPGKRRKFLDGEKASQCTLVFFESPHRLSKLLDDALHVLGNRLAAVCIEMTKKFEDVKRGYLADLIEEFAGRDVRGEITVVIAGDNAKFRKEAKR